MANGYKGDVARLVNSDYLYKVLKLEDDRVKAKLKDELYEDKTRTVIDTPENYVACQSTDTDALEVVADGSALTATQVELSTVQAFVPTAVVGEYYQHIAEVSHDEPYTDTIYRKKEDSYSKEEVDAKITAASTGMESMTPTEFNDFFDNLVVTASSIQTP